MNRGFKKSFENLPKVTLENIARLEKLSKKVKVAVLISGNGTNLQALIDACIEPNYPAEIVLVISNKANTKGIERAREAGITTRVVDHTNYSSAKNLILSYLRSSPIHNVH